MNKKISETKIVDKFRLIHWLNIRKTTVDVLNDLLSNKINRKLSFDDCVSISELAFKKSVKAHLRSDVGYAVQLSGGVDSSLVAALAAQETSKALRSFA